VEEPKDALGAVLKSRFAPEVAGDDFQPLGSRNFVRIRGDLFQFMNFQLSAYGGRRFCVNYSTTNLCEGWEFFGWHSDVGARFPCRVDPPQSWWKLGFGPAREPGEGWWESKSREFAESSISQVLEIYMKRVRGWMEATATPEAFIEELRKCNAGHSRCGHNKLAMACTLLRIGRTKEGLSAAELAKQLYLEDVAQNPGRDWCFERASRCDELLKDSVTTLVQWRAKSVANLKLEKIRGA
jgi:hypothetical protein